MDQSPEKTGRSVFWVWETIGNTGKNWLLEVLSTFFEVFEITP